jgi:hypothetical protein
MAVILHGFDWDIYAQTVMPAFASWFLDSDASHVHQLYEHTHYHQEELFLPPELMAIMGVNTWAKAEEHIAKLKRDIYSKEEYQVLCSAEHFLEFSDTFAFHHVPQLLDLSSILSSLRAIWSAIVEEYCFPWREDVQMPSELESESTKESREELTQLLRKAGLSELADEAQQAVLHAERQLWADTSEDEVDEYMRILSPKPQGILISEQFNILRLRAWLASQSIHAMVLFEYLAIGRRAMPFGFAAHEPMGCTIGYLTPEETLDLDAILQQLTPKTRGSRKVVDNGLSRKAFVDEKSSTHMNDFIQATHQAATQRLGLLCMIEHDPFQKLGVDDTM